MQNFAFSSEVKEDQVPFLVTSAILPRTTGQLSRSIFPPFTNESLDDDVINSLTDSQKTKSQVRTIPH
jgi:hypothetical protein